MKNKATATFALGALLTLCLAVPAYAETQDAVEAPPVYQAATPEAAGKDEPFSCYTYDDFDQELQGYWSEEQGIWYLFETSTQAVEETELYYTGDIEAVSAGTLDAGNQVVTGAFQERGDRVELTDADGTVYTVVVLQSDLPSVYITLNGTTLEQIHADKDAKYPGNSVTIMDPSGNYNLNVEGNVEMKGRGNTTWRCYEKKGYQIKFDKKTDVFGMGKAKKWVLLANAGDDSMMRTQLVYQMADNLEMDFVPSFEYVDLWISGEYRGTYMLGEKVEPGSSRLDLSEDAGALFEHDGAFYAEEEHWFYSAMLEREFALKEINNEDEAVIESAMADFEAAVDELAVYLYSTPSYEVTLEELSTMIDVDSFAKYFLVNEYAMNRESFYTSFYWYKDGPGDVLHLGPIWDFDTCMGNNGSTYTDNYGQNHVLFQYLLAAPAFYERTQELLALYWDDFTSMTDNVDVLATQLETSAEMNYLRWDVLGKPNPKGGTDFHNTYEEAVTAVKDWLSGREEGFHVTRSTVVTSEISDDCYEMTVTFQDGEPHQQIRFGVWSLEDGQDDLAWYTASQDKNGAWSCTVDLSQHNSAGRYFIHAYDLNSSSPIAAGRNYVATAREPRYRTSAVVADDCKTMEITMEDTTGLCTDVTFAVWSDQDGQDDLEWYTARKNAGNTWTYTVNLKRHQSAGTYYIHVYSGTGSNRTNVDSLTASVAFAVAGPDFTANISADNTAIELRLEDVEGYSRIWVPVWSEENGQDDITWCELYESKPGTWIGEVLLEDHGDTGTYHIHAYGGTNAPQDLIAYQDLQVSTVAERSLRATVDEGCDTLHVTARNTGSWQQLWIAVWSEENGQDDLLWYQPERAADGSCTSAIDLRGHLTAGVYHIHIYGGSQNPEELIEYTTAIVPDLPRTQPYVITDVQDSALTVTIFNARNQGNLWVPVWSEENGQDDIQWYRPVLQEDGTRTVTTDLNVHGSVGAYHLHVYSGSSVPQTLLGYTDFQVSAYSRKPALRTEILDDNTMTVLLKGADGVTHVWVPVWSEENGQDDMQWYQAIRQSDGSWTCSVNLAPHGIAPYHVHAYAGNEAPAELLAYSDVFRP